MAIKSCEKLQKTGEIDRPELTKRLIEEKKHLKARLEQLDDVISSLETNGDTLTFYDFEANKLYVRVDDAGVVVMEFECDNEGGAPSIKD